MMLLDPVKTVLRLRAVTLLPESSYVEVGRCGNVVLRWVSYFTVENVIVVVVGVVVDLLQRTLYIGVACCVRLIAAAVKKAVCVEVARAVAIVVGQVIFVVER